MRKLNVLVAGSTGYIGIQLVKLLVKHQNVNIMYLCGNSSVGIDTATNRTKMSGGSGVLPEGLQIGRAHV